MSNTHTRYFDADSPNWHKNPEINKLFILNQENYVNHLLKIRGHVFLNEVFDCLGLERSSVGAIQGWLNNPEEEKQIVFEIGKGDDEDWRYPQLTFNTEGEIYQKI